MKAVVIAGGGVAGLALALALGERGHRVRVLEQGEPPPQGPVVESAERWQRPTVPQAAHDHILNSLGVRVLRRHAPAVLDVALKEGARLLDLTSAAPAGRREPGDDDLVTLVARRSLLDLVLHQAVRALPGVRVSHRSTVARLLLAPDGSAGHRATGVVTRSGETIPADLVVDASGRRSVSRYWLTAAGLPVPDDLTDPSCLRSTGRFYRLSDPSGPLPGPLNRGNAAGGVWDHYAAVLHPADNDVFAITFGTLPGDRATAALHRPGAFTAACRLSPHLAAWVDPDVARPLGPVRIIGMPPNILRGTATDRRPPVAGLLQAGDAACVTDPIYGRGMSLALAHAFALAELLDEHPTVDQQLGRTAADLVERLLRPWYDQSAHDSRARVTKWRAAAGLAVDASAHRPAPPVPGEIAAASAAAATDRVVWRAVTRVQTGLSTPAEVLADVALRTWLRAATDASAPLSSHPSSASPTLVAPPGPRPPTRAELCDAIAAPEGG